MIFKSTRPGLAKTTLKGLDNEDFETHILCQSLLREPEGLRQCPTQENLREGCHTRRRFYRCSREHEMPYLTRGSWIRVRMKVINVESTIEWMRQP